MSHEPIHEELKEYEKVEPRYGKDRNRAAAKIKQLSLATQRRRRRNKQARISRRNNRH